MSESTTPRNDGGTTRAGGGTGSPTTGAGTPGAPHRSGTPAAPPTAKESGAAAGSGADTSDPTAMRVPMGTLVFGLVLVGLGLIVLVGILYGVSLDPGVIAVSVLVGSGLLLVVGGLLAGRRRGRG
ncbi:MAG: hypothetical protein ABWX68_06110 [Arthrobacter sp.]|uniref:hypothetical protein n=1 Tax=Arthrobacter sp. TaxID=1667 RepID=UPI003479E94B